MLSQVLRRFSSAYTCAKSGDVFEAIHRVLPECSVSTADAVRQQHGHDESHHRDKIPDLVISPGSVEEVSTVIQLCNEFKVPVVPFGTGTGLESGVSAPNGGVSLVLTEMQNIEVNENDFSCVVQPGVTRKMLNSFIHDTGLWFPVDPGADASLCGMCATSASGTNAVRYGTMKDNVMNLEVVLPSGEIIHTRGKGRRARKSSAGYNLTNLFVGSEGTLGAITSATLRLFPYPEKMAAAVCSFPNIGLAVDTVVQILQCCVPMARIELLDEVQMDACDKFSNLQYDPLPTLFMEFHGSENEIHNQTEIVEELCSGNEGSSFQWSSLQEERERLWTARHDAYYAALALKPGTKGFTTDICVPISNLTDVVMETKKDIDASHLIGPIVGHVGDGNFHCIFLVNPEEDGDLIEAGRLSDAMVKRALAVGGTCTGEHGVGIGKKKYLVEELGKGTVQLMKTLKKAMDPNNIMNPGKIF